MGSNGGMTTSGGGASAAGPGGGVNSGGNGGAVPDSAAGGGSATAGTAGGALAGAGGTGAVAGSGGAGGGSVCPATAICEDFEQETVGQPPATGAFKVGKDENHPPGTVVVDSTEHYSGAKSIKVSTPSGGKSAMIRLGGAPFFPAPGNAFYGRMMYRMEAVPDVNNHSSFIEAGGLVPGMVAYHAVYRYGTQKPVANGSRLLASYETDDSYKGIGPKTDCGKGAANDVLSSAKWTCVEWFFDGANRKLRLWLDGVAIDSVSVDGSGTSCVSQPADYSWIAPTFDHVDLGWASYQTDGARTAWVDDVVISQTRVQCPLPPHF